VNQYYSKQLFVNDIIAAFIVTALLITQSIAYAMLAGLPPQVGLFSSILPIVVYSLFGSSTTLSVGPVAIISLMTASAIGSVSENVDVGYAEASIVLALLSGLFLVLFGLFRLGLIINFISKPVVSGFITASSLIIVAKQIDHFSAFDISSFNSTLALGVTCLTILLLNKQFGTQIFSRLMPAGIANLISKAVPFFLVVLASCMSFFFDLEAIGVAVVGYIPQGLPSISFAEVDVSIVEKLALPALMISLIGYVESVSVAQTLGAKKRETIIPNRELIGLVASNVASGLSGGMPVTGGFSRSAVNFEAGAATKLSNLYVALGVALAALFLTPYIYYLPKVVLASLIIVAVIGLMEFVVFKRTWLYSKSDFLAVAATVVITLTSGVEAGVISGVIISLCLHLYRTSKPHIAEVGLLEGTEHFRNVKRFDVTTCPRVLSVRQDESLFFANAEMLQAYVLNELYKRDQIAHVIIQCSAVNEVDYSALTMLENLNNKLFEQGVLLHLSEVKGPVDDKLATAGFYDRLTGNKYLSQYDAFEALKR